MAGRPVGKVKCPIGEAAGDPHHGELRLNTRERYYWSCRCGTIQPGLPEGQAAIQEYLNTGRAWFFEGQERRDVEEDQAQQARRETRETIQRQRVKRRRGLGEWVRDALGDEPEDDEETAEDHDG